MDAREKKIIYGILNANNFYMNFRIYWLHVYETYRCPDAKFVLSNPDLRGTVSRPQPKPFFPGGTGHCVIPDFDRHPYPDLVLRSIIDNSQVTHYRKDDVHFGVCPIRQTV